MLQGDPRWAAPLAVTWGLGIVLWSWPSFQWTLEYYKKPGPEFFSAIVVAAPLAGLLALGYAWLRRHFTDRSYEALLIASPIVLAAILEPVAALVTLAVLAACLALGARLLKTIELQVGLNFEDGLLSFALGLAAVGYILMAVGSFGGLRLPFFLVITLAPILLDWRLLLDFRKRLLRSWRDWGRSPDSAHLLVGVCVPFVALFALSGVAVLLAPPIGFDAVNFHLPLVLTHAESGAPTQLPANRYSYNPQAFELLLAWPTRLAGLKAAQFLPAALLPFMLGLVWSIGRRCDLSRTSCALAVAVVAVMPGISFAAVNVKNDSMTSIFQLACLLCFLRWRGERNDRLLMLGAVLLGASFSVKHTALFFGAGLGLLGLIALSRSNRPLRTTVAAAALSMLAVAPWYWRTYAATGSPTYPMTIGSVAGMPAANRVDVPRPTPPGQNSSLPILMLEAVADSQVRGYRVYESLLTSPLGLFVALFLPAPWLIRRRPLKKDLALTAILVLASVLIWMVLTLPLRTADLRADISMRYITSALALGPLLLTGSVLRLWESGSRGVRFAMAALVAYSGVLCWIGVMIIQNSGAQARYLAGKLSESDYLDGAMVQYRPVQAARGETTPQDRVLSIGACATLYHEPPRNFTCFRVNSRDVTDVVLTVIKFLGPFDFLILNRAHRVDVEQLPEGSELVFEQPRYRGYRLVPRD